MIAQTLAGRPLISVLVLAGLALLPFLLILLTSFVKISVVLSLVRSAIGAPQIPPTTVITGLAILLSAFVMAPVAERIWKEVRPVVDSSAGNDVASSKTAEAIVEAGTRAKEPVRDFLLAHAHKRDRVVFADMARRLRAPADRASITDRDLLVVMPAFVTSELKEAFQIGFLLFIPFLVIDMVVSNILLALGMHMLSPTTVSLPFKLLLFVLVDGWILLSRGLLQGYAV